jgi:iron(III) transport system ATP-binding protein
MTEIKLQNVTKLFDDVKAVDSVSFTVAEGEVLTLLGPSGCGKSTTLRMIAGFLYPDEGKIFFGDQDVTDLAPQKRNTAMVFQSYALWPHLSVRKNVEFGLNIRKVPKPERDKRVKETLDRVRMVDLIDRMPSQLSGGQQQRVAVARALAVNPEVLLLDEPLSNLDAKLRIETRQEIRDLVKDLGLTTIFVTHDQSEALSISDRIAVLNYGSLLQLGTPENIWTVPESAFIGSFIGEANTIEMKVLHLASDKVTLEGQGFDEKKYSVISSYFKGINRQGESARVVVRPELFKLHLEKPFEGNIIPARIQSFLFFGNYTYAQAKLGSEEVISLHLPGDISLERNSYVYLEISPDDLKAFGPSNY